jgi:hypothetical protein
MAGIILTAMSAASSAQETLSGEQLIALIEKVRSFEPRDQFDTLPPQPSLAGKRFSYMVEPRPIGTKTNCAGYPEWVWLPQQRKLNISWSPTLALTYTLKGRNGPPFPPNLFGIRNSELMVRSFTCSKTNEPSYMANNAFGAQFSVEKTSEVVNAIADIEQLGTSPPKSSWEALVSGDAARQLSASVRVRVSGTLSDWWPGVSVVCGQKQLQPTIRLPFDRTTDMCLIRGQIERVEVVDQRSGAVLYSVVHKIQRAQDRR